MIDAIVSVAVQKLGDFLIQEMVLEGNVRRNIEWLRNELGYMSSFAKDAEEKQGNDHRVRQWISEIMDFAYDTVTILENFNLDVGAPRPGFLNRLRSCVCICKKNLKLHKLGKEIEYLKGRVLDISRKRETYGIRNLGDHSGEGPSCGPNGRSIIKRSRRATSYAEEEENLFVGLEDVTERLLNEILKDEPRRSVISILGMGGLGKTTVARKLYNSSAIMNKFPYRAWVCVSQEYSILDLLQMVIKSVKSLKEGISKEDFEMLDKMKVEDLECKVRETLKDDRYLVVVDDVWHKEAWESLRRAFPDSKNGSRVIITTRKKDVATRTDDKCFVHELRFLTPKESWDLFCKKLSGGEDYVNWCSIAMLDLGREMMQKCGGLPLAIIVLGGLLSHKKRFEEWHKVKEHLWRQMKNDSLEISQLLSLSYDDLSSELKQCFLYLGMSPEDSLINSEKLMWLWMAEGFIQRELKMEDIAEDYLNELIDRSLIQVASRFWGKVFECRIHDLLRDLAVEKAMETSFFNIYDPRIYSGPPSGRRLAIHSHVEKYLRHGPSNLRLRSILFFNPDFEKPEVRSLAFACEKFIHLCVLDLENVYFDIEICLPSAIGVAVHLRYLGLTNTNLRKLPRSIANLKNLQIFEALFDNRERCLVPEEFCELTNLRHINCRFQWNLNLGSLTNLRTLRYVNYEQWMEIDASNLINLQELAIENLHPPRNKAYSLDSVGKLKNLRNLFLCCSKDGALPPLEPLSSCQRLLKLWLKGRVEQLSALEKLPKSITELTLSHSLLDHDPMPALERLLNLQILELYYSYTGSEITCGAKGFRQLRILQLAHLYDLEKLQLERGALPAIRGFGVHECAKLKVVPERLIVSVPVLKGLDDKYASHIRLPDFSL